MDRKAGKHGDRTGSWYGNTYEILFKHKRRKTRGGNISILCAYVEGNDEKRI